MRIALVSSATGEFVQPPHVPQNVEFSSLCYTSENFLPRVSSLSTRLQARIPKMFAWQMNPGFDLYVWLDASFSLSHAGSLGWFVESLGDAPAAFFLHPERQTVRQEAEFIRQKIASGNRYLTRRYVGEDIDGHLALLDELRYPDDCLYATGAFVYRTTEVMRRVMWKWWAYTSRYHAVDQLSLPVALWEERVAPAILLGDIFDCETFDYRGHR